MRNISSLICTAETQLLYFQLHLMNRRLLHNNKVVYRSLQVFPTCKWSTYSMFRKEPDPPTFMVTGGLMVSPKAPHAGSISVLDWRGLVGYVDPMFFLRPAWVLAKSPLPSLLAATSFSEPLAADGGVLSPKR